MAREKVQPHGRRKRTGSTAVVVPKGYDLVKAPRQEKTEKRNRNSDPVSQGFGLLWRHRWQLTPVVAFGAVAWAAATSPAAAAITLGCLFVLAQLGAKKLAEEIRGRKWLSVKERDTVSMWAAGAGAWCATVAAGAWPATDRLALAVLAVLTLVQSAQWWMSRRIRRDKRPSKRARELVATWPLKMGTMGPTALKGSKILPGSVLEPAGQSMTFTVRLFRTHSEDAVTPEVRKYLERALELGVGTAQIEPVRDDSGLVKITLTPDRHLEKASADWSGPVLHGDGDIDFAVTPAGESIRIGLHNQAGVEHLAVVGVTGTGKSNSAATALLPGVMAQREVVWYCDGKRGASAAFVAGACDWWAVKDEDWPAVIEAGSSVLKSRQASRSKRGLSSWRGAQEKDPVLTLFFDEATVVGLAISLAHQSMLLEIIRAGRAFGIRVGQATQDPLGTDWIGGRVARDQIGAGGSLIGHRPGSGTASVLSAGPTSDSIDLRSLPGGPGWCGVIRQGQVIASKARVRYAAPEMVLERLVGFTPRGLAGRDLMAAGDAYRMRVRGVDAAAAMARAAELDDDDDYFEMPEAEESGPAEESAIDRALNASQRAAREAAEMSRGVIVAFLRGVPAGATATQVGAAINMPRPTAARHLARMEEDGRVKRDENGAYMALPIAVSA